MNNKEKKNTNISKIKENFKENDLIDAQSLEEKTSDSQSETEATNNI